MDHKQMCAYCAESDGAGGCRIYPDTTWVNRRGGCPYLPYREIPRSRGEYLDGKIVSGKQRAGQQKQKISDRTYKSKWDRKNKFRKEIK